MRAKFCQQIGVSVVDNQIVVALKGVIIRDGKLLIIKRSDSDEIGAGTWETPGGKLDFGEYPEDALVREIKEEVGLDATVDGILYASSLMTNSFRQVIIIAYRCTVLQGNVILSDEHSDHLWATNEELVQLLPPNILTEFQRHKII